ncbi:uncharacterized protein FOMMEDRAFT_136200 [Fomitiporia mediterranea MF3/22]|uniref:uncharacterized protein n=1 Tax=Fomitiporia mediterranea (strain MF3/22) TaxID=694068 RepID=UPI0004408F33|nr:uncharacterized protein FOMMEDRAFT_136200 [Fomitiporia mediterranea MF3/22]EJD00082.1 hypothetical protein FOMMEDRAFT_136200 [Fomitiporia mediterranea MF3/22]
MSGKLELLFCKLTHLRVKLYLDPHLLTLVENTFSKCLGPLGFDFHNILVDIHKVLAFGSNIRSYKRNISDMKQMTGYNFEDLLQCALLVFNSLFLQLYETIIYDTIVALHSETWQFDDVLQKFASNTCPVFATMELAAETHRHVSHIQTRMSGSDRINTNVKKAFNTNTSKVHIVEHYTKQIVEYRTTDSYSTNIGKSEHKMTKDSYARTNRVNPEVEEEEEEEDVELAPSDVRYSIRQRGIPINLP